MGQPLNNLPTYFAQLTPLTSPMEIVRIRSNVEDHTTPLDNCVIMPIFDLCVKAKGVPWSWVDHEVKLWRGFCERFNFVHCIPLISFVAFNSLFSNQCTDDEIALRSEEILLDLLRSKHPLPANIFDQFSKEVQGALHMSFIFRLSMFSRIDLLETISQNVFTLFTLWRKGRSVSIEPFCRLEALLQFPEQCWEQLDQDERSEAQKIILDFWALARRGSLRHHLERFSTEFQTTSRLEWTPRLIWLRKMGCMHMLCRTLKIWSCGIETSFPGYIESFFAAASVYADQSKQTEAQVIFVKRLIKSHSSVSREAPLLNLLKIYLKAVSVPSNSPKTKIQYFLFKTKWVPLCDQFSLETNPKLTKLMYSINAFLIKKEIHSFDNLMDNILNIQWSEEDLDELFYFFESAFNLQLSFLTAEIKTRITFQVFRVLLQKPHKKTALDLLDLIFMHVPAYPKRLVHFIRILYNRKGYRTISSLLLHAEWVYRELQKVHITQNESELHNDRLALTHLLEDAAVWRTDFPRETFPPLPAI